jgi:site-specific DNA recombinase
MTRLPGIRQAIQTKEKLSKMVDMEASLKDLCARIIPDLDHCSNEDKKDAYTYLGLEVKATPDGADIKGFLDPCLLTTGQTWA